jgi:hypothetical protein
MEHSFEIRNGLWWCLDEDCNADECTDYERCTSSCVCNTRDGE